MRVWESISLLHSDSGVAVGCVRGLLFSWLLDCRSGTKTVFFSPIRAFFFSHWSSHMIARPQDLDLRQFHDWSPRLFSFSKDSQWESLIFNQAVFTGSLMWGTCPVFSICPARMSVSVRHARTLSACHLMTLTVVIGYSDHGGSNQRVSNRNPVYL